MKYSCAKTIAVRLKITMPQVFKKYGSNLKVIKHIVGSAKPREIEFVSLKDIRSSYNEKSKIPVLTPEFDPFKIRTFWRTTFKLYSYCCVCGQTENIEMHHINSLKNIKTINKDGKTSFNKILQQLNRKQVPVCKSCHNMITSGQYSGKSIKDLFDSSLAGL